MTKFVMLLLMDKETLISIESERTVVEVPIGCVLEDCPLSMYPLPLW